MNNTASDFSRWEQQIIALAGVTQSAALVHKLANAASVDDIAVAASINSLLVINPSSLADIYPNVSHLSMGLRSLQDIFSNDRVRQHGELVRYTLGMLVLRNKLVANDKMQARLRSGLQTVSPISTAVQDIQDAESVEANQLRTDRTFEQLATLYQDTISTLTYRIQVQGKVEQLKSELTANQIRALLLAGIRAAVLWHQLGGRRWRLVIHRKRILDTATTIRKKLIVSL